MFSYFEPNLIEKFFWETLRKFVAENNTEKSQLLWNSILQKEMLHWKFFSAI